ncbi:MAG: ATP synthase F1 subunit gamma [Bacteriovoracaceae bacterium]
MANIKDLKKKIKTTKSTLKITTAMKLVSAAKMAKAQAAIVGTRPYANELEDSIKTISALARNYSHSFLESNDSDKTVVLVISANKGLCGGYNSQLAKKVLTDLGSVDHLENYEFHFIGKKVKDALKSTEIQGDLVEFEKNEPTYEEINKIAVELSERFLNGEVGKVLVAYNIFNSAISFTPTIKQVLPLSLDQSAAEELKEKHPFDFKYDPSASEILDTLIPETYSTSIYTSVLDAAAAEHGSRMTAMDNAVGNCKDAIRSLTLQMNKARQAAITTELIEVVSGAESLNG